jgi:hypothetical protein
MDDTQRRQLYNAVVKCRQLLEVDFGRQLEGAYGIESNGRAEPLNRLTHLDAAGRFRRQAIDQVIAHYMAAGAARPFAVQRFLRESAFTFLNRLAALKLMEHPNRALIPQSVGAGAESKGFRQFSLVSPEATRAEPDGGYRLYLELLCDDLGQTLGLLFDRSLPTAYLFPKPACLQEILALLNAVQLADVWGSDETIGWVYQYFTPTELREEARKASGAPRNSYELAFRNQFYTPRYVVCFLAENTLGRLWYQARQGETHLVESCRYLIRRNSLDGDLPPVPDPRELKCLDPAVGSAHLLLYTFDLLQIIYEEAYDDPTVGPALQADYSDRDAYRRDVPRLILAHNLHGIDIDRRAVQIATLALWLRAHRAYKEMGVKMQARPRLEEIHIVCAEPMPGEHDLLGEFARDLQPAVLGNMLRDLWEKMKLAGEAGSLLKIEQEIQETIRASRRKLAALPPAIQLTLFAPDQPIAWPEQLNPADLDDAEFWAGAENRILATLRAYALRAARAQGVLRRLFAADAVQGLAFIHLLQQQYHVVLMNPPFGAPSLGSKEYLKRAYPRTKNDLYAAFVERGLELLRPGGYLGAITSRTGFFLTTFQKWREEILLQEAQLITMADLGYGVLDTAMVETAAYVLQKRSEQ